MKRLFEIVIGERDGEYWATMLCSVDKQTAVVESKNIATVVSRIGKLVKEKAEQLRKFQLPESEQPEPSRIITPANGHPLPEIVRR